SEEMGSAFARWALGRASSDNAADRAPASSTPGSQAANDPGSEAGAPTLDWQEYVNRWAVMLDEAVQAEELRAPWNNGAHKDMRMKIKWPAGELGKLMARVKAKVEALKS